MPLVLLAYQYPYEVNKNNETLGPVVVRSQIDGGPEQLRRIPPPPLTLPSSMAGSLTV